MLFVSVVHYSQAVHDITGTSIGQRLPERYTQHLT